jgi:hypothetical protein
MLADYLDLTGVLEHPESYVDNHGHGTHIAGIVIYGNEMAFHPKNGHRGFNDYDKICVGVHVFSCKFFDPTNKDNDNIKKTVDCIRIAINEKMDVINYSAGGVDANEDEYKAIRDFTKTGGVVVVAAGNEHKPLAEQPYYPASYAFAPNRNTPDYKDNVAAIEKLTKELKYLKNRKSYLWPKAWTEKSITNMQNELKARTQYKKFFDTWQPLGNLYSVKALDVNGKVLRSSNDSPLVWGMYAEGVYSTLPGGHFGLMTGSSQAASALLHRMLKQK